MKTSLLLTAMFLGVSLGSQAQAPSISAPTSPAPQVQPKNAQPGNLSNAELTFDKEMYDFGTIDQGANGTTEFSFKNTGKEPLIIEDAKGSCGCTVPSFPKEPIKPGATGTIKVTYDTKRTGAFSKTVTVKSNSKSGDKMLTIKGNVKVSSDEDTFPAKKVSSGTPVESK